MRHKKEWLFAALVALVFGALGCGVGSGAVDSPAKTGLGQASTTSASPRPSLAQVLRAADVKLTIQTTSKDCFGSAGCNVTYRVRAGWPKEKVAAGTAYEVTYEVRGVEDGPQVGMLTIHDDGTVDTPDEFASTKSSTTKLAATVTGVEAR